jgi:hypothetical protein
MKKIIKFHFHLLAVLPLLLYFSPQNINRLQFQRRIVLKSLLSREVVDANVNEHFLVITSNKGKLSFLDTSLTLVKESSIQEKYLNLSISCFSKNGELAVFVDNKRELHIYDKKLSSVKKIKLENIFTATSLVFTDENSLYLSAYQTKSAIRLSEGSSSIGLNELPKFKVSKISLSTQSKSQSKELFSVGNDSIALGLFTDFLLKSFTKGEIWVVDPVEYSFKRYDTNGRSLGEITKKNFQKIHYTEADVQILSKSNPFVSTTNYAKVVADISRHANQFFVLRKNTPTQRGVQVDVFDLKGEFQKESTLDELADWENVVSVQVIDDLLFLVGHKNSVIEVATYKIQA